jgi:choline monooxygenase
MLSPAAFPDLTPAELAVEPVERAATIPASWYVDPRFHDLDRAAVFAATWQHVGDAATLDRPGALARADVAGEPLLILRPGDGGFRAFYDVCRHRGGPLPSWSAARRPLCTAASPWESSRSPSSRSSRR